ncbi:transcription factor ETV7 [Takifugu flavidus]|uniref:transcription factor ETV7 n=1 Tax=Takifugu flavidus TaxID=433684 RepID=UPI0025446A96|nr:transcription factor ETV7 [Takifugu flavidus]
MFHGNTPVTVHQFSSNQLPVGSPPTLEDLWRLPGRLRINPSLWDKEDVALWLHWAQKEYSLRRPEKGRFEMNGRALCLLTKEDFRHRCPSSGDVLFEILQCVKMQRRVNPQKRSHPLPTVNADGKVSRQNPPQGAQESAAGSKSQASVTATAGQPEAVESVRNCPVIVYMYPSPVTHTNVIAAFPVEPQNQAGIPPQSEIVTQEPLNLSKPNQEKHSLLPDVSGHIPECRLLWDYVYHLLCDNRYQEYIRWEDQDRLVFRVVDPNGLARLWGHHKRRDNMTYEKLSRALRHYYKLNIIKKERGQKLLFRFLKLPKSGNLNAQSKIHEDTLDENLQDPSSPHDLTEDHFEVSPDRASPQPPP